MRAAWRTLAGRRDLRLVLSAGIISMTGDWVLTIGLIYRVARLGPAAGELARAT